jgi:general stress protein 26
MSSINREQPEKNFENLHGPQAVQKIKEIVDQAKSCFFCTAVATGISNGARPMNVRQVDDQGNLWFLSASDSSQNEELAIEPAVRLFFQGSAHSDFLQLIGHATISRDRAKIEELWEPVLKTWFTDGIDDARITVLKFTPADGYYWDTKHGNMVSGMKMMIGAVVGQTLDDSIEGKLRIDG